LLNREYYPKHLQKEENGGEDILENLKNDKKKLDLDLMKGKKEKKKKKEERHKGYILLPERLKHPNTNDSFYPVEYDNVIFDCFNLKVIYDRERTGFEETKEFPIVINSIIAGRYQILEYLGSAAFSKAI